MSTLKVLSANFETGSSCKLSLNHLDNFATLIIRRDELASCQFEVSPLTPMILMAHLFICQQSAFLNNGAF